MCELGELTLKNKRALMKPWRVRIVVLKGSDWVDVEGLGFFILLKEQNKKGAIEEAFAVYKDLNSKKIEENSYFIRPKLEENVLQKLHQGYIMKEGTCLLYSKVDRKNNYNLVSEDFIEWKDKKIGLNIGLIFLNNMSCLDIWNKLNKNGANNLSLTRKQKFILNQNHCFFINPSQTNLSSILENIKKHPKYYTEISLSNKIFLEKLICSFNKAELEGDLNSINQIYEIIECIIKSEDENIYNVLLNDENYIPIFSILEYDKDNQGIEKQLHRLNIIKIEQFHNFYDILDENIINQIKYCKRLIYLIDCIFASFNEESFYYIIQKNIHFLQEEITTFLIYQDNLLFQKFIENFTINFIDSFKFLNELISLIESSINVEKKNLFFDLISQSNFYIKLIESYNLINSSLEFNKELKIFLSIELTRIIKKIMIYNTSYFCNILIENEINLNFLNDLSLLYIEYGEDFQNEINELWKLLAEDIPENESITFIGQEIIKKFIMNILYKEKNPDKFIIQFIQLFLNLIKPIPKTTLLIIKSLDFIIKPFQINIFTYKKIANIYLLKLLKEIIILEDDQIIQKLTKNNIIKKYLLDQFKKNSRADNLNRGLLLNIFTLILKQKNSELFDLLDDEIINSEFFKKLMRKHFDEIDNKHLLDKTIEMSTPFTSSTSINNKEILEIEKKFEDKISFIVDLEKQEIECEIQKEIHIINEIISFEEEKIIEEFDYSDMDIELGFSHPTLKKRKI